MMIFKKYDTVFILFLLFSGKVLSIEPEELLVRDAVSQPCLSGSMKQEDLMVCVSKSYLFAQKKLNSNYKIALQQRNTQIRNYLISSQKNWNLSKFKSCYPELENGREGTINFIDCATKVIEDRNEWLETVFLCDFNQRACEFKDNKIIELLGNE